MSDGVSNASEITAANATWLQPIARWSFACRGSFHPVPPVKQRNLQAGRQNMRRNSDRYRYRIEAELKLVECHDANRPKHCSGNGKERGATQVDVKRFFPVAQF